MTQEATELNTTTEYIEAFGVLMDFLGDEQRVELVKENEKLVVHLGKSAEKEESVALYIFYDIEGEINGQNVRLGQRFTLYETWLRGSGCSASSPFFSSPTEKDFWYYNDPEDQKSWSE